MTNATPYSNTKADIKQGILRWAVQMLVSLLIAWSVLFLSAGKLNWTAGWAFFALNALTQILSSFLFISRQPGMLAERSKAQTGTKSWDKFFTRGIQDRSSIPCLARSCWDHSGLISRHYSRSFS